MLNKCSVPSCKLKAKCQIRGFNVCKEGYQIFKEDNHIRLERIRDILKQIKPYLIIKTKQADLMIDFCNSRLKSKVKNYSNNDFQTAVSFSELNKKGRVS